MQVHTDNGRRRRLSPEREAEILSATLSLLEEVGYQGLTMPAVATLSRCSTATLYRQWNGKPGLVIAALQQRHPEKPSAPDTGTLRGDLMAMIGDLAEMAESDLALMAALAHASLRDEELAKAMRQELASPSGTPLDLILDHAIARHEIEVSPETRRYANHTLISISLARQLAEGERPDRAYLEGFVDAILLPILAPTHVPAT